jgi:pimeloyl-ACP methyl ester carboxylesterase
MKAILLSLLAFTAIFSCGKKRQQSAPISHADWESAYVQSNGIRIHYWRTGGVGKPVMILAHGITDFGLNWATLAEKFQSDYDIIMYDARGHGYSDKPEGPYDLNEHVEDLVGLVKALNVEKPVLVGHSMGGATVALTAAVYPEIPRAVILEDPADMLAQTDPLKADIIPDWKKMIAKDRRKGKKKLIKMARSERHPGWTDIDYDLWAESKLLVHLNVVDILKGDGFGDAGETYAKIAAPTLILKADADEKSRAEHQRIAALLPNGKLVHIDGAGHVIRNDRPVETEREIRAFLEGLGD